MAFDPGTFSSAELASDVRLAFAHHSAGRRDEAEAVCRRVLERQPRHAGALHLLAVVAHARRRLAAALELARMAVAAAPDEAGFRNTLGIILGDLRRWEDCFAAFGEAIRLDPAGFEAHRNLAVALSKAGQLTRGRRRRADSTLRFALGIRRPQPPLNSPVSAASGHAAAPPTAPWRTPGMGRSGVGPIRGQRLTLDGSVNSAALTPTLRRLTSAGSLDTTFGTSGKILGSSGGGTIRVILVQTNGELLAGGDAGSGTAQEVWMFTPSGAADTGFASGGTLTANSGATVYGWAVASGATQRIVVAGSYGGYAALAAFAPASLRAQQDANYNVMAMVDSNANVVQRYLYDPYGNMTVLSATWTPQSDLFGTQVGFQGMWLDAASGLYHTPNRDYSVELGRWAEQDPSGYGNGADLYESMGGDPVSLVDPTGLAPEGYSAGPYIVFQLFDDYVAAPAVNYVADQIGGERFRSAGLGFVEFGRQVSIRTDVIGGLVSSVRQTCTDTTANAQRGNNVVIAFGKAGLADLPVINIPATAIQAGTGTVWQGANQGFQISGSDRISMGAGATSQIALFTAGALVNRPGAGSFSGPGPRFIPRRVPRSLDAVTQEILNKYRSSTTSLYHKGNLVGGEVVASRVLSTGRSCETVSRLNRAGPVFEFQVPTSLLNQWLAARLAQEINDYDNATGTYNDEVRIYPPASGEMNKFKK